MRMSQRMEQNYKTFTGETSIDDYMKSVFSMKCKASKNDYSSDSASMDFSSNRKFVLSNESKTGKFLNFHKHKGQLGKFSLTITILQQSPLDGRGTL